MARLSVKKAAEALRLHHGVIQHAALACGVHRHTMRKFIDDNPELEEVRQEADEVLLDIGEGKVAAAINDGDMKTVRWHLERKGKDRGYTTRTETTGKDGEPLQTAIIERRVVDPADEE